MPKLNSRSVRPPLVWAAVFCDPAAAADAVPTQLPPGFQLPTLPAEDVHARALLCNALQYVRPESQTIDRRSGYPVEGWNDDPQNKLALRSSRN